MGATVRAFIKEPLDSGIIEFPQWYPYQKKDVDPNDLIRLAGAAGTVISAFPETKWQVVLPQKWKGSVPKGIMVNRIKGKIKPEEHKKVELPWPESLEHNVYDAVGIGLYALKRL